MVLPSARTIPQISHHEYESGLLAISAGIGSRFQKNYGEMNVSGNRKALVVGVNYYEKNIPSPNKIITKSQCFCSPYIFQSR